jgi:rhodanese-related sulfurtransferase
MRRWSVFATTCAVLAFLGAEQAQSQQFVDTTGLVVETEIGDFVVEGVERIEVDRAHELFLQDAVFVDLRNVWRYDISHIPGAIGLELKTQFSEEALAEHVAKDQAVVFYCNHSACPRSAIASAHALTWGYTDVYHFADGWSAWKGQGLEQE